MSMGTYMLVALEGDTSLDYWVKAITEHGLYMVRDDLIGVCKFAGLDIKTAALSLGEVGLHVTKAELQDAVKRAFIRALWLERKQGFERNDYTLPSQVLDRHNEAIDATPFVTREFFAALSDRVWEVFDREIERLPPIESEAAL
jgi:aldehyde:ferredoxin oxidoreductase